MRLCNCGCGREVGPTRNSLRGHAGGVAVKKKNRYSVDAVSGCWIWLMATDGTYGIVKINDKVKKAHRAMYEEKKGPIPEGLVLDHSRNCISKLCVNPDHLEPVTPTENTRRRKLSKIDIFMARELRHQYAEGKTKTQLSKQHNLSLSLICDVIANRTWKEEPNEFTPVPEGSTEQDSQQV